METSCHNLPGITEIRYIPITDLLPYLVEKYSAGAPISVEKARSTRLEIFGAASCVAEQSDENNGRSETATLDFYTLDKVPQADIAFLVRQASGRWFLVGCRELSPKISLSYTTGETAGESSVTHVTATFIAHHAMMEVAV